MLHTNDRRIGIYYNNGFIVDRPNWKAELLEPCSCLRSTVVGIVHVRAHEVLCLSVSQFKTVWFSLPSCRLKLYYCSLFLLLTRWCRHRARPRSSSACILFNAFAPSNPVVLRFREQVTTDIKGSQINAIYLFVLLLLFNYLSGPLLFNYTFVLLLFNY